MPLLWKTISVFLSLSGHPSAIILIPSKGPLTGEGKLLVGFILNPQPIR